MALILNREKVLEIYNYASNKGWVLPVFNTENLTTSEAILSSVYDYGESIGVRDLPIIVGITNNYPSRPQSQYYTHTRQWKLGMNLFLNDLKQLTLPDSPFANLKVMIHLDHILWDEDQELLNWDMGQFSSIMFDASDLPLDMNIQKTAEFVKLNKDKIIIEGACAEIGESFSNSPVDLTSPDMAEKYYLETGVDILVANLGTEHRASSTTMHYQDQLARDIKDKIGPRLCLHGTSSISMEKLSGLFDDGICKVNIWTTLERDTTPALINNILENISKMVDREKVNDWINTHLLGEMIDQSSTTSLDYFTTTYRQDIIFNRMKEIVHSYLNLWYK